MQDAEDRRQQRLRCSVMRVLRTPEAKRRLGLGDYHPQCYLNAARHAVTSYDIDDDMASCLQHAARWATATKTMELCADPEFGGDPTLGQRNILPIGVECPLPRSAIPPLPQDCNYTDIVNNRPWVERPRQTAHCACTERYDCQPEDLLSGQTVSSG
ncbi:hypothetical protein DF3PB_140021 [uncultured Defluviicoccus sp.]|uniref:Uncharacterized protein n=1 Tax=metagenome TaxID=256318 RepID=A0A380TA28_9ZZZZ|nr:hypothetical protein DF3PB_140021 [uncultured Defluviicoccus sp.]